MTEFLQYLIAGITAGAVYSLVAIGFTLIFNATGVINFAHGELVVFGALTAHTLHYQLHLPLFFSSILAVSLSGLLGLLLEKLVVSPLKNSPALNLIIATIGASLFLRATAMLIWGKEPLPYPHFFGEQPFIFFGIRIMPQTIWNLFSAFFLFAILAIFFKHTLIGKSMRATSLNREAALLMGINPEKTVELSFFLSALLAGLAGVSIAPLAMLGYGSGAILGLKGFASAILGGLENPLGALTGGLCLGILESLGSAYLSSGFKDAIALIIMLLILFFKPSGIFGKRGGN